MNYENMTNAKPVAWHPEKPHNQLPPLPPPQELESRAVLKACITARAALAQLKQAAELIPNQTMLINTIPLLEAKDSSEIENIVTTTDKLFLYAQTDGHGQADPATKEALRYRSALHRGYQSLTERPLCTAQPSRFVEPSKLWTWISARLRALNLRMTKRAKSFTRRLKVKHCCVTCWRIGNALFITK